MREIKFRAWDKRNKKMLSWWDINDGYNFQSMIYGDILELINEEGERIKAMCRFGNRRLTTKDGITIDIQCFYFEIGDRKTNPVVVNYKGVHDLEIMEIIGNIYENPELLEVE